ncbi:two-component response-regulatory protein YehT [Aeromonas diversa CDC 2478-85]|uniref:Two-component response-regulatory protein YehT n=1 Tax=Aeromonas diversa CDC 2478-85 TaxID=1268237 RepID=N9VQH8_9GAMM|nr:two-component system response regulator BtsR [Aeromonas diversa]ENY73586.1 two-component response-regulatory protein YehT [Aeromonas diversa CDC 2478-85]
MITALIIDDEHYARAELKALLAEQDDLQILGEAANAIEALAQIQQHKPDVLFLDIQMPQISGMELLALLTSPMPRIVFVTAFDDYAVQAFEENAFDYLLKPIEPRRLDKTLRRLRQDLAPQALASLIPPLTRLPVYCHDRVRVLPLDEVEVAFSDPGGVHVYSHQGEVLHTQLTLKTLEERTPLLRCHRQYLVHPNAIRELHTDGHQVELITSCGQAVPVSRRFLRSIRDQLGLT